MLSRLIITQRKKEGMYQRTLVDADDTTRELVEELEKAHNAHKVSQEQARQDRQALRETNARLAQAEEAVEELRMIAAPKATRMARERMVSTEGVAKSSPKIVDELQRERANLVAELRASQKQAQVRGMNYHRVTTLSCSIVCCTRMCVCFDLQTEANLYR